MNYSMRNSDTHDFYLYESSRNTLEHMLYLKKILPNLKILYFIAVGRSKYHLEHNFPTACPSNIFDS